MRLNGRNFGGIIGELNFDGSFCGDFMGNGETDHDVNILLIDVEFILGAEDFKTEISDSSSQLEPSVRGRNGVGDSFGPSFGLPAVADVIGIDSGDGKGHLGDFRVERDEGSVVDVDGDPVDFLEDYTPLIEIVYAVVYHPVELELRIHHHDKPVVLRVT